MFNLSSDQKEAVIERIKQERAAKFDTDTEHAKALGINQAVYSTICHKGDYDGKLKEDKWNELARYYRLNIQQWVTAETPSFKFLMSKYIHCHQNGHNLIVVDEAGKSKTETAEYYVSKHKNAVYVDCSEHKSRRDMLIAIAKGLGINTKGKFKDMRTALFAKLRNNRCIVFLDEAGDLVKDAFLEVKALENAAKHMSAVVLLGADGLRAKIERGIASATVGYSEIFDRAHKTFTGAINDEATDAALAHIDPTRGKLKTKAQMLFELEAAMMIKANMPDATGKTIQQILTQANGSYRSVRTLVEKITLQN